MSRGPDAGTLLERRLRVAAADAGVHLTISDGDWCRWASATFTGARHRLVVELNDDDEGAAWLDGLPELDLPLNGHLLADIVVAERVRRDERLRVTIEALTLEER